MTVTRIFCVILLSWIFMDPAAADQTDAARDVQSESGTETPIASAVSVAPLVDNFSPTITDRDLQPAAQRAWEFRPYQVAVWLCLDGSPELNAVYPSIVESVTRQSELIDPSGWDLQVGAAPAQFRWQLLHSLENPGDFANVAALPILNPYDKLMVVCLNQNFGRTIIRVREFDVQTQQWGPLLDRHTERTDRLGSTIIHAIKLAFMPLARVDRVIQKDGHNEVFVQVRAVDAAFRSEINAELTWEVNPLQDSPVFIQSNDKFLPVIRRTDRDGELLKLEPIDFTFLTIDESQDESNSAELKCSIQSSYRAPLAGRTSKRSEKLALVIRAPQQPTTLFLHSFVKSATPLEGFDIYSRRPAAIEGESNEYLGKTNWQGELEIPPSDDGLRIILVSRGSRALKRLPIMPGFYDRLSTAVPNDETSLYAEGVLLGLENEILNLVIQRKVFESDIESALEKKNLEEAKSIFKEYESLESPSDMKNRLANEEVRLKNLTQDKRELDYIVSRFSNLRSLLNNQAGNSQETKLQEEIQKQSDLSGT